MSQSSVCHICLKEDAPLSRVTRRSNNNWLQCDSCKHWLHAECSGYTTTEFRKLTKDRWFKCFVCCLQLIHNTICEVTQAVTQAVDKRVSAASGSFVSTPKTTSVVSTHTEVKDDLVSRCSSECQVLKNDFHLSDKSGISTEVRPADNILIVDNINNPSQFSSSKHILKEVNLFCPEVKVEFGYSLARGGVLTFTLLTRLVETTTSLVFGTTKYVKYHFC